MEPMEIAEALNSSTSEALRAARDWRQSVPIEDVTCRMGTDRNALHDVLTPCLCGGLKICLYNNSLSCPALAEFSALLHV
jgi:hypothetical protein